MLLARHPAFRRSNSYQKLNDLLHVRHVTTQLGTDLLNWVRAQCSVNFDQTSVIYTVVFSVQTATDNVRLDTFHEIAQQWDTGVVVQVTTVLCSIRDSCVHFVQFLAHTKSDLGAALT